MSLPVVSIHGEISAPQPLAMTVTACKVGWDGEALGSAQALVHAVLDG
jgi:hypothetical protein